MNTVILMGRLTRDPEIRYTNGENATAVANYRLAVDRRIKREGQPTADFFDCVSFGKQAEFVEKYLHQGTKMVVQGRLQNDDYTDKEGRKVYKVQVIVENQEFAESKTVADANRAAAGGQAQAQKAQAAAPKAEAPSDDGFMNVPDSLDEELPFS